ncbi:hypothetical protein [Neisseria wadsworthii]|uniref:hypothetical protein n=1 Tax=Neisseria wadsworthii TaxID=607711 RepID=UPI000D314C1A|nr:hypothetical protein [Neisseria wadsworthii]
MKIENLHRLFRLNSILIFCYLVILFLLVFVVDFRLNLIEIPGAMYLERKSLFPTHTFNSITFTILTGTLILVLNIPITLKLLAIFIKTRDMDFFNNLKKRYFFVYYFGFGIMEPHRIWKHLTGWKITYRILAIFGFLYMVFILLYWMFGWTFIQLPPHYSLVNLVSKFKIALYILNLFIFGGMSLFLLTTFSAIFLIIYSFFYKNI